MDDPLRPLVRHPFQPPPLELELLSRFQLDSSWVKIEGAKMARRWRRECRARWLKDEWNAAWRRMRARRIKVRYNREKVPRRWVKRRGGRAQGRFQFASNRFESLFSPRRVGVRIESGLKAKFCRGQTRHATTKKRRAARLSGAADNRLGRPLSQWKVPRAALLRRWGLGSGWKRLPRHFRGRFSAENCEAGKKPNPRPPLERF